MEGFFNHNKYYLSGDTICRGRHPSGGTCFVAMVLFLGFTQYFLNSGDSLYHLMQPILTQGSQAQL